MDEGLPLGDDDLFLLFGNGAAHVVRLPEAVAAELAENLDDLLLIDDAAVGHGEDRLELRAEIGDALRMKLVFDETRDGIHGARAVEGDDGGEVLDGLRLHVDTHARDPGGFQLENARRLALTQHGERCSVAVRQPLEIKVRLAAADGAGGVVEDRQIAQAEKVHFEKAKLLDGRHGKLRDDGLVVARQRHIVADGICRDDDACGVRRGVAGHALEAARRVDELFDALVALDHRAQLRRDAQRLVERHVRRGGDLLGHGIRFGIRQVHDAADVADGGTGGHGAERHDLCHMVLAVFAHDVVDDLAAAELAEVRIEIRHAHALRVQKALEDEVILHGVHLGDVHAIGRDGAGTGAAPRPDRDALLLCPADEIRHNEIIVDIAHLLHDGHLVFQPLTVARRGTRVALTEALIAHAAEIRQRIAPVRRREGGQMIVVEFKFDLAAVGNALCVFQRLRQGGEEGAHLVLGLQVELLRLKAHAVRVVERLAGLDAQQHILQLTVLAREIMRVVRRHERKARLLRDAQQAAVDLTLLRNAVVLQLQIEMLRAENAGKLQRIGLGSVIVPGAQPARDLARQTGRQSDQALAVLPQQGEVYAGLAVKALQEPHGDQIAQIAVARFVFAQQDQMARIIVHAVDAVRYGARCDIDLAADDGLDALGLCSTIKVDHAVHDAVIGDGQRSLAQLFGARSKPADAACAVEQTEFAVDVKMYECHEAAFLSRKSAAVTPGLLRSSPCPLPPEPAACACGG